LFLFRQVGIIQFYGIFGGTSIPNTGKRWNTAVSNAALDAADVAP